MELNSDIINRVKAISDHLKQEYGAEKVILFGSYALGEASEHSDVDLLIIAETNEKFIQRIATIKRLIRHLRNGIPVAPLVLTPNEIESRLARGDQFVSQILEKGTEV